MNIIKQIQTVFFNQFDNSRVHRSDQVALKRAYAEFARQHPGWAAAYFDELFLVRHAAFLLKRNRQVSHGSMAFTLAMDWSRQFHWNDQFKRRRLVTEATSIADDFLQVLEQELDSPFVALSPVMQGA